MNLVSLIIISETAKQNGISLTDLVNKTIQSGRDLEHKTSDKTIRNHIKELMEKKYLAKKLNPNKPKGWPLYFIGSRNVSNSLSINNNLYFSNIMKQIDRLDNQGTSKFFETCYFYAMVLLHKYKIYSFIVFSESYDDELEKTAIDEDLKQTSKIIKEIFKKMKQKDSRQAKHVVNAIRLVILDEDIEQFSHMKKHSIFK